MGADTSVVKGKHEGNPMIEREQKRNGYKHKDMFYSLVYSLRKTFLFARAWAGSASE